MRVPARCVTQRQHVKRVKTDRRVQVVVIALCRMNRFRTAYFLRRFAEELESPLYIVPQHHRFGGEKTAKRGDAKCRMWIGVAARVNAEAISRTLPGVRRLAISRYGIVFRITTDRRSIAIAPLGAKGGRHASATLLNIESFRPQQVHVPVTGSVFAPCGFAMVKDHLVPVGKVVDFAVDPFNQSVFWH